jgi:DNA primase
VTRIKEETDLVSVVREYVQLKPAGTSFKGLCPFHREKTPSFHVNPQRQIYKCFGCGEGGDAIAFLMKLQGMTFPEAVEILARPLNIDLARYLTENDESEGERQAFFRAMETASTLWQEDLWGDAGAEARAYLTDRGFGEEVLRRYEVGYARDGHGQEKELERRGVGRDLALRTGLLRQKDGRSPFAYFRNRIIFPIKNIAQRVAGFGGRAMGDGEPKYLNSAESSYFNKRDILYGFALSRIPIARRGMAILVEGYLDMLALAQAGYANSVATCGTAFTQEQARLLKRGCRSVYVLFDGDKAGLKAAVRSAGLALGAGLEPKVARLPEGEDPASFLLENEPGDMAQVLERAAGYLPLLRDLAEESGLGREGMERAVKTGLQTLAGVNDPIRRSYLLGEASDVFGLPREILAGEVDKIIRGAQRRYAEPAGADAPDSGPPGPDEATAPEEETLLHVDRRNDERFLLVHVMQDDGGAAARLFLELYEPGDLVLAHADELYRDLADWAAGDGRGTSPSPAVYVQSLWHERSDGYRRLASAILADAEGASPIDHSMIVRECHQRLNMVRNRRRELDALRAFGRDKEGSESP